MDANHRPAVAVDHLSKCFGQLEVLSGLSVSARDGDVLAIIGSSGSGKSTLLRCINMLEVPDSGTVSIAGEEIGLKARRGGGASRPTRRRSTVCARSSAWCSKASISGRISRFWKT